MRRAFTLVEMLVTIVIIGILATMSMAALRVVQQSARIDRTKATIAKLDTFVTDHYEAFRSRRLPINFDAVDASGVRVYADYISPADQAGRRLDVIRDLMRLEMPDRWSDVTAQPLTLAWTKSAAWAKKPGAALHIQARYLRARNALLAKGYGATKADEILNTYESAKLLYMIVSTAGPDAMEHFREDEIGRPCEDGLPVFVDAWERPILFIRWAPGFDQSEIQSAVTPIDSAAERLAASVDISNRDPWNTEGVYRAAGMLAPATTESGTPSGTTIPIAIGWKLLPLVYSAGPDGAYDIWAGTSADQFAGDPYAVFTSFTPPRSFGSAVDFDADGLGHYDNITNHQGMAK